jgi:hypothetical protein
MDRIRLPCDHMLVSSRLSHWFGGVGVKECS